MSPTRSIEVKVGLLILTAIVLLVAFILVMGGISFQPTYTLHVGFDNPGGLQTGAPVKIAGVKVGKVKQISFMAAQKGAKKRRSSLAVWRDRRGLIGCAPLDPNPLAAMARAARTPPRPRESRSAPRAWRLSAGPLGGCENRRCR